MQSVPLASTLAAPSGRWYSLTVLGDLRGDSPSLSPHSQSCLRIPFRSLPGTPRPGPLWTLPTSHTLLHPSHSQDEHVFHCPNRDTLRVKRAAINSYTRTTGVHWDCPGEAGHLGY